MVGAVGKIHNNTRPLYIIGAYLSTRLKAREYHSLLETISLAILKIKSESTNPYVILAGDFNKKDVDEALGDYPDMEVVNTTATRRGAVLDLCATNFADEMESYSNLPPLESEDGTQSDHNFLAFKFRLSHVHDFRWVKIKSRKITEQAVKDFGDELSALNWADVLPETFDIHGTTAAFHETLVELTSIYFPTCTLKFRSTDNPWIDEATRKAIGRRVDFFEKEGRSVNWKEMKKITNNMIKRRKKKYYDAEVQKLRQEGSYRIPYKVLKNISDTERAKTWSVEDLSNGRTEEKLAEDLAVYFSKISQEFSPLQGEPPTTYDLSLIHI